MTRVAYTVTASFGDPAIAEAFVEWLLGGHLSAVIAGGARSAMIVRLDPDLPAPAAGAGTARPRVEVRYEFATRADFERYLELHAPALRAEGLARFGPAQGVTYMRSTGTIV